MKNEIDILQEYYFRSRPFSFYSTLDCVTTGIALLESWLEDYCGIKSSDCPFKRKTYLEVSSLVKSLRASL